MIPLEMKGMVRHCHPPTPIVGLYRQSRCPIRTKESYDKARAERDIVCLPSMLHHMVSRFKAYRALRRQMIQALHTIFVKGLFCDSLIAYTMEFLSYKKYEHFPPIVYTPYMYYDLLDIRQRFIQMSGRLVSLGYSKLVLPRIDDFDYEICLSLCSENMHQVITAFYQELVRKKVPNKWRILLSYLRKYQTQQYNYFDMYNLPIYDAGDAWDAYCNKKKIQIYFDKCLKLNGLSATEIVLLDSWLSYMKYPMY
jgi:hypothetical protein